MSIASEKIKQVRKVDTYEEEEAIVKNGGELVHGRISDRLYQYADGSVIVEVQRCGYFDVATTRYWLTGMM
jgi:hypothetical protein